MGSLEAFGRYCEKQGITSLQYQEEIWPVWQAAYTAGKREKKEKPKNKKDPKGSSL